MLGLKFIHVNKRGPQAKSFLIKGQYRRDQHQFCRISMPHSTGDRCPCREPRLERQAGGACATPTRVDGGSHPRYDRQFLRWGCVRTKDTSGNLAIQQISLEIQKSRLDDVMTWECFPHYWLCGKEINRF